MSPAIVKYFIGTALLSISSETTQSASVGLNQSATYTQGSPGALFRTVGSKLQEYVSLKDFGAVGDGVIDDTPAVQKAFSNYAAQTSTGKRLYCTDGRYLLASTITIESVSGLVFDAQGSCTFIWGGNSVSPMFDLRDVAFSVFDSIRIIGNSDHQLAEGFRIENGPAAKVTPSSDRFVNVYIDGVNGYIDYPFRITTGAGGDNNNDFHNFENVWAANYTVSGWSLESTQAHFIHFTDSHCSANRIGRYCVSGGAAAGAATSFIWEGGFTGATTRADFFLKCNMSQQPYVLRTLSSEGSNRFIDWDNSCGSAIPVVVEGVRWASNGLNGDGIAIRALGAGPITIRDSRIGEDYKVPVKIYWGYVQGDSRPTFAIQNTTIGGSLSSPSDIFPGKPPTYMLGVSAQTSDTVHVSLDRDSENLVGALLFSGVKSASYTFTERYATHPECFVQPQFNVDGNAPWLTYGGTGSFTISFANAVTGSVSFHCIPR